MSTSKYSFFILTLILRFHMYITAVLVPQNRNRILKFTSDEVDF